MGYLPTAECMQGGLILCYRGAGCEDPSRKYPGCQPVGIVLWVHLDVLGISGKIEYSDVESLLVEPLDDCILHAEAVESLKFILCLELQSRALWQRSCKFSSSCKKTKMID